MTTLFLFRHGETVENAAGLYQGQTPGHLSALGMAQAESARAAVAALDIDAVLCSDLARTRHTAAIVLRGTRFTAPADTIVYTPLLRERDMGRLTGLTIAGHPADDSVESGSQCTVRARQLLELVAQRYAGKRLLVVSHGYFLRFLQAAATGQPATGIPHFANCELRRIDI